MPKTARQIALEILSAAEDSHLHLDGLFSAYDKEVNRMIPADKAFLRSLVYGTVRWRGRLDWIVKRFSTTPLHKIKPQVLNCLRLALFQIIYLDKIPVSAAVNTAVEMAKTYAPPYVVKFANAVLRKAARDHAGVPLPPIEKDPVSGIAVSKSMPRWLVARWIDRYGIPETLALCDATNAIPPITVRTNLLLTTRSQLLNELEDEAETAWPCAIVPEAISFRRPGKSVQELTPYNRGAFQVQDEAAQLVSHLLSPGPGERVLDACAGVGGKTGHMAQLMAGQGRITALDQHAHKLRSLQQAMALLGVDIVQPHTADLLQPLPHKWLASYDRILLDAPCSGLGVIRRHPDIKWRPEKRNLARYQRKYRIH